MDNRTFFDQRPSHRPIPPDIIEAERAYRKAVKTTDDYIDTTPDVDVVELEKLYNAERSAYYELQKLRDRTQNCTCKPNDVMACPSCKKYIREKYGDTIPVE